MLDLMKQSNIGSGRETTLEYAIRIAASLAKFLIESKYSVQLLAYGKKMLHLPFDKGQNHLSRILKLLATVEVDGTVPLSQLLVETTPLIPVHSELLLIMLDTDLTALQRAIGLVAKSVSVRPFMLFRSSFAYFEKEDIIKKDIRKKQVETFSSSGIVPHIFYCGDNLETSFRESVK